MKKIFIFLVLLTLSFQAAACLPHAANAGTIEYTPLAPLPGTTNGNTTSFTTYVPGMYKFLIGFAGIVAVAMIVWGGTQYMLTDIVTSKTAAKERIYNAIWGLVLIAASFLILQTINPNLVNFNLDIMSATQQAPRAPAGGTPATGGTTNTTAPNTSTGTGGRGGGRGN